MIKRLFLLFTAVFLSIYSAKAQYPCWINYTNGSEVNAIETEDSVVWVGTSGGLIKIDGNQKTFYNKANSGLPGNDVRDIAIDTNGNKWIATNYGIAKYDDNIWTPYNAINSGLPTNNINSIAIDNKNVLWVGTEGFGLIAFDGYNWTYYNIYNSDIPIGHIYLVTPDNNGDIWFGGSSTSSSGIIKFDGTGWTQYRTSNSDLPNNYVNSITIDTNGYNWVGTNAGIAKFKGTSWTIFDNANSGLPNSKVLSIAIDDNDIKWIGTDGSGLVTYDNNNWTVFNEANSGLTFDYISTVVIDKNENKWIGAIDSYLPVNEGLVKYNGTDWQIFKTSNTKLPSSRINTIAIDDNGVKWFGTRRGVARFDGSTWNYYNVDNSGLPHNFVNSIAVDHNGDTWIGTSWGGLVKFDGTNWTVYNSSNSGLNNNFVNLVAIDVNNNIWAATNYGLAEFDGTNWNLYSRSDSDLPTHDINAITIDSVGNKWIGTNSGLAKYNGSSWTIYNSLNTPLSQNRVHAIEIDSKGDLWLGMNNGLVEFDGNNWNVYNPPNFSTYGIGVTSLIIDHNDVKWTGNLLNNLPFYSFDDSIWKEFSIDNSGIPSNVVNSINMDPEGNIWLSLYGAFDNKGVAVYLNGCDTGGVETTLDLPDTLCSTNDFEIKTTIKNHGNSEMTSFEATAFITGIIHDTLNATFPNSLFPGNSFNLTIGSIDASTPGDIEIEVYTSMTYEGENSKDTLRAQVHILPTPPEPNVPDDSVCYGQTAVLSGSNTNNHTQWYLSSTDQTAAHTGSTFTTQKITANSEFHVKNFTEQGCYSARETVKVILNPDVPNIVKGSVFEGEWKQDASQPDQVCAGNTLSFEFPPPSGYHNSEFGTSWDITIEMKSPNGTSPTDIIIDEATSNQNNKLTFNSLNSDADSLYEISATYTLYPSQCSNIVSRYIKVNPLPNPDFTMDNNCERSLTSFRNNSSITSGNIVFFEWDFGNGNKDHSFETAHNYENAGTYSVTLEATSDAMCSNEIEKSFEIYETPVPDFEVTPQCAQDSFRFTNLTGYSDGSDVLDYEWILDHNINTSTKFEPKHSYPYHGIYNVTLIARSPAGCTDSISRNVDVLELPDANFEIADVCAGNNLNLKNLSAGKDISSYWTIDDSSNVEGHEPNFTINNPGTYDVNLLVTTSDGCSDSISQSVNIFEPPKAKFKTKDHCIGDTLLLYNASEGNDLESSWRFGIFVEISEHEPKYVFKNTGEHNITLTVTDNNGCTDDYEENVWVSPVPNAFFHYNISYGQAEFYPSDTMNYYYDWDFGDGYFSSEVMPEHEYNLTGGEYEVRLQVQDSTGCVATQIQNVVVEAEEAIYVPNAFSPNDDNVNDYFQVVALNIDEFEIMIVNRRGTVIFKSDNQDFKWDGRVKDNLIQDGVYVYVIRATGKSGKKFDIKGTLHLIK